MKRVVRMRKACPCSATSSGPRIIMIEGEAEGGVATYTFRMVGFACNACDKSWTRDDGAAASKHPKKGKRK